MTADVYLGLVMPRSLSGEAYADVEQYYGGEYADVREKMNRLLLGFCDRFGGLAHRRSHAAEYDTAIDEAHAMALRLVHLTQEMFDRVQARDRNDIPAVKFAWRTMEPMILFFEHTLEPGDDDDNDPQHPYAPCADVHFESPSIVFELCAALHLLAALELRRLERVRRAGASGFFGDALAPLRGTVQRLTRLQRTYMVAPWAECRSASADAVQHPLLVSEHFVKHCVAPLLYAQALAFATCTDFVAVTDRGRCAKAALLYASGMLLEQVCSQTPFNVCSLSQRSVLHLLGFDRTATAFANLAASFLNHGNRMAADAAASDEAAARRQHLFDTALVLLDAAKRESPNEQHVADLAESTVEHLRAIGCVREGTVEAALAAVERRGVVPRPVEIVSLVAGKPPAVLTPLNLLMALDNVHRFAIEMEGTQVHVLFQEPHEQNTQRTPKRVADRNK